ncbi:DUF2934 domain-containing protein, partial [Propylenella binzhouense]
MAEKDEDRIRERAYRIWEEEGRPEGRHDEHWHRAGREMGGEEKAVAADEARPDAGEAGGRSAADPGDESGRAAAASDALPG